MDILKVIIEVASGVLDFADFVRISETCKTLNTYIKNIKFGVYNINALDYSIYKGVREDPGGFLYKETCPLVVKRFLDLFGYTCNKYNYRQWRAIGEQPLYFYCRRNQYDLAKIILDFDPSLASAGTYVDSPFLTAVIYSYDITKYMLENCDIDINYIQKCIQSPYLHHTIGSTRELLIENLSKRLY